MWGGKAFLWAHVNNLFIAAPTRNGCASVIKTLIYELNDVGFYVSQLKLQVRPSQKVQFCGLCIDLSKCQFNLNYKFKELLWSTQSTDNLSQWELITLLHHSNSPKSKKWQPLLGWIIYLLYAIGLTTAFRWWAVNQKIRYALANIMDPGPWPLPQPLEQMWVSDATPIQVTVVEQHDYLVDSTSRI